MTDTSLRLAYAGLHPDRLMGLLEKHRSPDAVLRALLGGREKCSDRVREALAVDVLVRRAELVGLGARFVGRSDPSYPSGLAALPDAPLGLFVRGEIPGTPAVAVVGTRRCTTYGRRLAADYGEAIATAGWVLVSGLARGIDGAAHEGTLAAGGVGVAVLGCGIDVAYPPEHAFLAQRLMTSGGAVTTEYPPGTPPEGWRFPPRNRIISGLASAVVVVEAGVKGGALITAGCALTQGVPVFAVPGDVRREASRGSNLLIRDGAHPVLDRDDLIQELSLVLGSPAAATVSADGAEGELLALLGDTGVATIDQLVTATGLPIGDVLAEVTRLEAKREVSIDGQQVTRSRVRGSSATSNGR